MNIRHLLPALCIFALLAASCKEEEETATSSYIYGNLYFTMPSYVKYEDKITVDPYGAYLPTALFSKGKYEDVLGYFYTNTLDNSRDTVKKYTDPAGSPKSYTFTVSKDTIGTFILTAYVYYPGYYNTSRTKNYAIVKKGYDADCSIQGFDIQPGETTFEIEGRKYYCQKIGENEWLRENLSSGQNCIPYDSCPAMKEILGAYYNWNDAQTACPDGWRITSSEDWDKLLSSEGSNVGDIMADVTFNGTKMWSFWPEVKISDKSRLSVLPAGYGILSGDSYLFRDFETRAVFWTSNEADTDNGIAKYIYQDKNILFSESFDKNNFYASVRCVRKL